jgi:hypothetical protein
MPLSTSSHAAELLSVLSACSTSSESVGRGADDLRSDAFITLLEAMAAREESWHARERRELIERARRGDASPSLNTP